MKMNRDQIAATVAGQMASVALEAEWIAQRAYDIADALIKARGAELYEDPELDIVAHKVEPADVRAKNSPGALKEHLTEEWQDLETLRKAAGLTYAQATYQIKREDVQVKQEGRKKFYRIAKTKMELPKEQEGDPRIAFAKSLGYKTIPAALEAMGSWEFEKQFKQCTTL